jgi:hypothetical protein
MASLGDLVVNLVADSSQFTKGLGEAQASLNRFAAAATAMAGSAIATFISVGSALDDMRIRTGISAETLSGLSYAAKLSDTSMEALQGSLVKMTKFTEAAAGGSKDATDTLAKLGLTVQRLKSLSPDQQFMAFADALNAIQDPGQRAVAAMAVFGKGVAGIDILLREGSAGIQGFIDQNQALGNVMDDETAMAAAATADAIDDMVKAATHAMVAIGEKLAPAVKMAADVMTYLMKGTKEFGPTIMATIGVLGSAVMAFNAIAKAVRAFAQSQLVALAMSGPKGWAQLAAGLALAGAATYALSSISSEFADSLKAEAEAAQAAKDAQNQLSDARQQAAPQKSQVEVYADALKGLQANFDKMNSESAQGQSEALRKKINGLNDAFYTLSKLGMTDMTKADFEKYRQAAVDAFSGAGEATKKLQQELAILRGETTAAEIELQRMAAAGASNAQIEALRQMQAEREKLLAQQAEEAKRQQDITSAAEQSKAALKSEVDAIKEGLKTPRQKLEERQARINELEKMGQLNLIEAALATSQINKEKAALDQQTTTPAAQVAEPKFAAAAMRGSGEAFSTILASMSRRDPVVAATEKQTKDLLDGMAKNKPEFAVAEAA